MLDLESSVKKLSWDELRMRWKEYKQLPAHAKQALHTYAVVAVLLVGALTACVATYMHKPVPTPQGIDRLGLLIELTK
jgi:hypothetical protein